MHKRLQAVRIFAIAVAVVIGGTRARAQEIITIDSPWAGKRLHLSLNTSYATLQALDVISTLQATQSGPGQEANPMLGGLVDHPVAFSAVKGGLTFATMFAMKRYAKEHPKAAAITLIAMNIGYSYIVSNNFRIAAGR